MKGAPTSWLAWLGSVPVLALGVVQFFRGGWIGADCLARGKAGLAPTICVDPYWVNQWLKNYAGGFTKRGLIGEGLRHLLPGDVDLLWLSFVALLLLLSVYGLLYWLLLDVVAASCFGGIVMACLLVISPFGKSLAETALDPLQLCLLLASAVLLVIGPSGRRDLVIVLIFALASLVYEGCLLLLLPFVFLLARHSLARYFALVVCVLLLIVFQRQDSPQLREAAAMALKAVNPWTGEFLRYQDGGGLASSVGFAFNIKQEFGRYLADSPRDTFSRLARSLGVVLSYLFALLAAMGAGRSSVRLLLWRVWLWFVPAALPFVLITHDWFRYGVVLVLLALVVVAAISRAREDLSPARLRMMPAWQEWLAVISLGAMVVVGPSSGDVRKFLPHDYFHASLLMLLLSGLLLLLTCQPKAWFKSWSDRVV